MKKYWWEIGIFVLLGCLFLKYFETVAGFAAGLLRVGKPLLLGCVIAYILNIPLRFLERHYGKLERKRWMARIKRPLCILAAFGIVLLILTAVLCLVVPEVISSGQVLAESIPAAADHVMDWLSRYFEDIPAIQEMVEDVQVDWPRLFENAVSVATSGIGSIFTSAMSIVGIVAGGIMNLVIGAIFAVYVLANKEKLSGQIRKLSQAYLPQRVRRVSGELLTLADCQGFRECCWAYRWLPPAINGWEGLQTKN